MTNEYNQIVKLHKKHNGYCVHCGRRVYIFLNKSAETCSYGHRTCPMIHASRDHITPVSLGGASTIDNLVLSCIDCNTRRGNLTVEAFKNSGLILDVPIAVYPIEKKLAKREIRNKQTQRKRDNKFKEYLAMSFMCLVSGIF